MKFSLLHEKTLFSRDQYTIGKLFTRTLNSCIICKAAQASRNDLPYETKKSARMKRIQIDDFNCKTSNNYL